MKIDFVKKLLFYNYNSCISTNINIYIHILYNIILQKYINKL